MRHYGPRKSVSRPRVEREIDKLLNEAETLAVEMADEIGLLVEASKKGTRDVFGFRMRALSMKAKGDKLAYIALRVTSLRDLLYPE
jgi:hypothetical protein